MKWQDVSKIAKENGFVEEFDEKLNCPVLDEDKVSEIFNRKKTDNRKLFTELFFSLIVDGFFGARVGIGWKYPRISFMRLLSGALV